MINGFEDFQKLGKENMDVAMKSMTAASKGIQTIAAEVGDYSKKSVEEGAAAFENVVGSKSLNKALEVQTDYARQAYEGYVGQMTKIGEIYANVARELYKPYETAMGKVAEATTKAAK